MSGAPTPTIVERLWAAAAEHGGGSITFHSGGEPERVDAAGMLALARRRATVLAQRGAAPGTNVGIVGPNAPEWFAWVYAAWMLGATVVPLPIPIRVRSKDALAAQLDAMVDAFSCAYIAAQERYAALLPSDRVVDWTLPDACTPLDEREVIRPDPRSIAVVQTTSGTTAAPKGVARTYGVINATDMEAMMAQEGLDRVRSLGYSPVAHAGGFFAVHSLVTANLEHHLLAPDRFARDPGQLFRMVAPHEITGITAPSSGYAAALRSIERDPDGVDLSTIDNLNISFEMIDPALVDRLRAVGPRFGLRSDVVLAHYGASEGGGTRTPRGTEIRIDEVDLDALLEAGIARPARPGTTTKRIASCGAAYGVELRVAGDRGALSERQVGEVQFRGPALMDKYVGPGADNAFVDDGWMKTGDEGYVADGELYITGRLKEVIVQQGKKYHPEDIEWTVARALDIESSACVAFDASEGEVVVLVEGDDALAGDSAQRLRAAVMNAIGAVVRKVIVVPPESLPKASSGKAQRLAARDRFLRGEFR